MSKKDAVVFLNLRRKLQDEKAKLLYQQQKTARRLMIIERQLETIAKRLLEFQLMP